MKLPEITVGIIDSRSRLHPDWVQTAINSVKRQIYQPKRLIIVDNTDLSKTIGQCLNEMVREADTEWIFFLDDDDFIAADYLIALAYQAMIAPETIVSVCTPMTLFRDDGEKEVEAQSVRLHKGIMRCSYMLKYPWNEELTGGVDREYFDQIKARGDLVKVIYHNHGYYYRQHVNHRARPTGDVMIEGDFIPCDLYVNSRYPKHTKPYLDMLKNRGYDIFLDEHRFKGESAKDSKLIWCDWANEEAANISRFETNAKKLLRCHAYEAYTNNVFYIEWDGFDRVIFVADHIRRSVEKKLGRELENAVVIPNAVDLSKYYIADGKQKNNRIAWAGDLCRKKGIPLLIWLARSLPEYEFHVAGKWLEPDLHEWAIEKAPHNVYAYTYQYDLPKFFEDKTYILNTSAREGCPVTVLEGMACGLQPLLFDWIGADDFMGDYFPGVFKNLHELKGLLELDYIPELHRRRIKAKHNMDRIIERYQAIIDELIGEPVVV